MNTDALTGLQILEGMIGGKIPPPAMAKTIPMRLARIDKGMAEFQAQADENHLNPMGTVHGGFAATVLDSATGCAVMSMLAPGDKYATVDLNIKLLKRIPVGVTLKAIGSIIHHSQRLGVAEGKIVDGDGTIYAHATASCMILPKKHRAQDR